MNETATPGGHNSRLPIVIDQSLFAGDWKAVGVAAAALAFIALIPPPVYPLNSRFLAPAPARWPSTKTRMRTGHG